MKLLLTSLAVAAATVAAFTLNAPSASATANNPYAGEWCGTFAVVDPPDSDDEGDVQLSISPSGAIKGTFYNTNQDVGGTMTGHIDNDGTIHLNPNIYGTGPGGKGGNGEHHTGQAYIDENGVLVAPTTGTWHGAYSVTAVLELCD
jgi:hypothetical protein